MYCCCGVKKRDGWKCECDWEGWFLCYERESVPNNIPINSHPEIDGTYLVRVFEDGDDHETESEFSIIEKNWGEFTNLAISRWKVDYWDNWLGLSGVYAWKSINENGENV